MPSPAHKRPNRARQTARPINTRTNANANDEKKKNGKTASEKVQPEAAPRRSARSKAAGATKPPPKLRAPASKVGTRGVKAVVPAPPSEPSENEDEDENENGVSSDSSITARISRPRANRLRAPPPVLEEKIGWDSSSEP